MNPGAGHDIGSGEDEDAVMGVNQLKEGLAIDGRDAGNRRSVERKSPVRQDRQESGRSRGLDPAEIDERRRRSLLLDRVKEFPEPVIGILPD